MTKEKHRKEEEKENLLISHIFFLNFFSIVFKTKERAPFMCWVEFIDESEQPSATSAAYSARELGGISRQLLVEHVNNAVARGGAQLLDLERSVVEQHPLMASGELPPLSADDGEERGSSQSGGDIRSKKREKSDNEDGEDSMQSEQLDSAAQDVSDAGAILARIERESPFAKYQHWNCISLICKSNDDLMQEQFAMQLMTCLRDIWRTEGVDVLLRTYHIQAAAPGAGFIETVKGAQSIHALKKRATEEKRKTSIKDILIEMHGKGNS